MRGSILLRTTRCESSCSKAPDIASLSSARGTILLRLLLLLLLHELARVIFILAVPFTPSTVAIHGAWALVSKTLARRLCSTRLDLLPNIAPGRPGTSIYSVGILCDTVGRFALVKGTDPKMNSCCTHRRTFAICSFCRTAICSHCWDRLSHQRCICSSTYEKTGGVDQAFELYLGFVDLAAWRAGS